MGGTHDMAIHRVIARSIALLGVAAIVTFACTAPQSTASPAPKTPTTVQQSSAPAVPQTGAHQHSTATSDATVAALPSNSANPATSPSPASRASPAAASEAARASDSPSASPIAVTAPAPSGGGLVPTVTAAPTFAKPTITMTPSAAPATPGVLGKTTVAVRLNDAMTITLAQTAVPEGT